MSLNEQTVRSSINKYTGSVFTNTREIGLSMIRERYGFESIQKSASSTTSNSVNIGATDWLASIVGAFDDDPVYARIIENVKENRRRMDEQILILE